MKKKEDERKVDISSLSKQDLITLVIKIEQEIQTLKKKQDKTPEQQKELTEKKKTLEESKNELKKYDSKSQNTKSNNIPTGLVIGGTTLLAIIGLTAMVMIIKKPKKETIR